MMALARCSLARLRCFPPSRILKSNFLNFPLYSSLVIHYFLEHYHFGLAKEQVNFIEVAALHYFQLLAIINFNFHVYLNVLFAYSLGTLAFGVLAPQALP